MKARRISRSSGRVIWQTYTINNIDYANGANGASVWTTPAYDSDTNTIFVGTGNNYSQPTDPAYAACIAAGVRTLYSEDLGDGTRYECVTVINPFL